MVEVNFDPSNCLENPNKHWETTLHIPIPHQAPKEHQNRAHGSNFSTLKSKKSKNLFFKQFPWSDMGIFRPKKCSKRPNMVLLVPPVRYFDGQVGFYRFLSLLDRTKWEKLRKYQKSDFSGKISCLQGNFKVLKFDP